MNFSGIILGLVSFVCIGIFHPLVIKGEYYFGTRCWWAFACVGVIMLIASLFVSAIIYGIFAIYMIGYGLGHNILELVEKYRMDIYFESAGMILALITLRKIFRNKIKRKNK